MQGREVYVLRESWFWGNLTRFQLWNETFTFTARRLSISFPSVNPLHLFTQLDNMSAPCVILFCPILPLSVLFQFFLHNVRAVSNIVLCIIVILSNMIELSVNLWWYRKGVNFGSGFVNFLSLEGGAWLGYSCRTRWMSTKNPTLGMSPSEFSLFARGGRVGRHDAFQKTSHVQTCCRNCCRLQGRVVWNRCWNGKDDGLSQWRSLRFLGESFVLHSTPAPPFQW